MKKILIAVFAVFSVRVPWRGSSYPLSGAVFAAMLCLFPALALAQEASVVPPATPWWVPLVLGFFGILSTLITSVALPAWKAKLLSEQQANEAAGKKSLLVTTALKFEHFAEVVHADMDATMRPEIAKALADGKLTADEIADLRSKALERFKIVAGKEGISELEDVMGIAGEGVSHYLAGMIEKQVDKANTLAAGIPAKVATLAAANTSLPGPVAVAAAVP